MKIYIPNTPKKKGGDIVEILCKETKRERERKIGTKEEAGRKEGRRVCWFTLFITY